MIKMAAMPIYVENSYFSSLEPKGQWPGGLVCSTGDMGPMKFEKNYDLGLTLTFFTERSNVLHRFLKQNFKNLV